MHTQHHSPLYKHINHINTRSHTHEKEKGKSFVSRAACLHRRTSFLSPTKRTPGCTPLPAKTPPTHPQGTPTQHRPLPRFSCLAPLPCPHPFCVPVRARPTPTTKKNATRRALVCFRKSVDFGGPSQGSLHPPSPCPQPHTTPPPWPLWPRDHRAAWARMHLCPSEERRKKGQGLCPRPAAGLSLPPPPPHHSTFSLVHAEPARSRDRFGIKLSSLSLLGWRVPPSPHAMPWPSSSPLHTPVGQGMGWRGMPGGPWVAAHASSSFSLSPRAASPRVSTGKSSPPPPHCRHPYLYSAYPFFIALRRLHTTPLHPPPLSPTRGPIQAHALPCPPLSASFNRAQRTNQYTPAHPTHPPTPTPTPQGRKRKPTPLLSFGRSRERVFVFPVPSPSPPRPMEAGGRRGGRGGGGRSPPRSPPPDWDPPAPDAPERVKAVFEWSSPRGGVVTPTLGASSLGEEEVR